jgi:hypothetical protein
MTRADRDRPHFRDDLECEISDLERRIEELSTTVDRLSFDNHETANAWKELERLRGRLDMLRRIACREN